MYTKKLEEHKQSTGKSLAIHENNISEISSQITSIIASKNSIQTMDKQKKKDLTYTTPLETNLTWKEPMIPNHLMKENQRYHHSSTRSCGNPEEKEILRPAYIEKPVTHDTFLQNLFRDKSQLRKR